MYITVTALFHPNFGVFPLHPIAHVGVSVSMDCMVLKLFVFGCEIIFEVGPIPNCVKNIPLQSHTGADPAN